MVKIESNPVDQMHTQPMPGEVRRRRMLSLIDEREFMRVTDLAHIFEISEVTVRSDLDQLAHSSSVERVHGGVMTRSHTSRSEPTFEESSDTLAEEKAAIGRVAAALVSSGDSLVIDVGTTATAVAHALTERTDLEDIVVFTNGLTTAMQLESAIPRFTVILTGGTLRPRQHSLVGPMGTEILDQVNVTTAFIGCNGIHPLEGVTNVNLPEAQIKSRMIETAQQVVVVADGTKIGKISVARIARLDDIDKLITTESAPLELLGRIRELGVDAVVAT